MQKNNIIKHSPLIALLITGAVALLVIVFLLWPAWQSVSQVSQQILDDRTAVAAMEEQDAVVTDFASKYSVYQAGLESIEEMFVDAKNPVKFFEFIETTANLFSVQAAIQLSPRLDGKESTDTFQISIKNGAFENVVKFSKALENGPYAVGINKIDMKTAVIEDEKASAAGVDADIIITTLAK